MLLTSETISDSADLEYDVQHMSCGGHTGSHLWYLPVSIVCQRGFFLAEYECTETLINK